MANGGEDRTTVDTLAGAYRVIVPLLRDEEEASPPPWTLWDDGAGDEDDDAARLPWPRGTALVLGDGAAAAERALPAGARPPASRRAYAIVDVVEVWQDNAAAMARATAADGGLFPPAETAGAALAAGGRGVRRREQPGARRGTPGPSRGRRGGRLRGARRGRRVRRCRQGHAGALSVQLRRVHPGRSADRVLCAAVDAKGALWAAVREAAPGF